jgi:hypothetical protein
MLTLKDSKQRVVTISKEDKNQNEKKNTETKLTGNKARKLPPGGQLNWQVP